MTENKIEIPDKKTIIIAFPSLSQPAAMELVDMIKKRMDEGKGTLLLGGFRFEKVAETDKILLVNGETT